MTDLLLTHGYFLEEDAKEREIMKPYPPLGLLYLSAFLKRAGFSVDVFDTTFGTRGELEARLDRERGVVGVYTNLLTRASVLRVIRAARDRGWTVVLGGPESANHPAEYLAAGAHAIVRGEGERTMEELLPALAKDGAHRLHGVAGVTFLDETGALVANPERAQIPDLDGLPWPDREAIDVDRYVGVWRERHGSGSVNLITARGCPYKCRWCSHAVFGFSHRRRSAKDCADEVAFLNDRYRPDQLWYADDVFTIHHRWLFDFARELDARGLRLPFETISRADRMMDEEVLATLARMGCTRIWIGSESGSQRILDAMERGVTVEQVRWAAAAARRHGIAVGMFLMWGYDGETLDDVAATVEHVKATDPDVFLTTVAYPIRNTGYFHDLGGKVSLEKDWAEATDRDYDVGGRAPKAAYTHADRWLKSEVEAARLAASEPERAEALRREALAAREALARELGALAPAAP